MKKFIIICLMSLLIVAQNNADCGTSKADCLSEKTFFRGRSSIEDATLFLAMNNYRIYQKYMDIPIITDGNIIERDENFYFHGGVFFENSRKPKEIKKYFFPTDIITSSNNLVNQIDNYLLCPHRELLGVFLNYHQDICSIENLWVDAKISLYRARHSFILGCKEEHCAHVDDFLNELNLDKISLYTRQKFGIDDLEAKLGYMVYQSEEYADYLNIYGSVVIPTASKPKADFLFEPLVGRAHWGAGVGLNGGFKIFEHLEDKRYICVMTDLSYQYLFSASECRLSRSPVACLENTNKFLKDLNDLSSTIDAALSTVPLSIENKLTSIKSTLLYNELKKLNKEKFKVIPGSVINFWLAMHYQHYSWNIELGYNLWWKAQEKVSLKNQLDFKNGIDLALVTQPSALTNKIYILMGYFATEAKHTLPVYVGGSYEFAKDKNALEQWAIWLGIDFSF
ncbi:MAG: hypothetical protein P4L22_06865 [Candidatus Babeliales bacterium]|nr:hypothetical protein [Candidatus Babeliales bacterium]